MAKGTGKISAGAEKLRKENKRLKQLLLEANESINAVKEGKIDALVIKDAKKIKIFTEKTADKTYRVLVEKMNEGAVTLNKDETILYCNSGFAKMMSLPLQKVIGTPFINYIDNSSKKHFENLLKKGWKHPIKDEIFLKPKKGKTIPALISFSTFKLNNRLAISIILTDIAIRHKVQEQLKEKNSELEDANKELAFRNREKKKRAAELSIANKKLAVENKKKEKLAAELIIANKELDIENIKKEKLAAELIIANKELAFQNRQKEKRAEELSEANKELITFAYVSSHDLQEPLRKIQTFVSALLVGEKENLSSEGKNYLERTHETAQQMRSHLEDLLAYSRVKDAERKFEKINLGLILEDAKKQLEEVIKEKKAIIKTGPLCETRVIKTQFRQLLFNLLSNALKFTKPGVPPDISITSEIVPGSSLHNKKLSSKMNYCHIIVADHGIGFDPQYKERIFEVFQRLHNREEYEGSGVGLAICKRIAENHNGAITATGELDKGARFDVYIPAL